MLSRFTHGYGRTCRPSALSRMLWCSKMRVAGLASLSDAPVGVTAVRSKEAAKKAVRVWIQAAKQGNRVFAVDTEVANIDLSFESPVGHGNVICASVYGGPDLDFGNGPKLWIDNHGDAEGVLQEFKDVLESRDVLKVYHNYGFDRHVLYNHDINALGFGGDTMHMARLWQAGRLKGGYSLESLTDELLQRRKVPMSERFAVPKLRKNGTPGKETYVPRVEDLQTRADTRMDWIDYSTYDAEGTWLLYQKLRSLLEARPWGSGKSMFDFYNKYWVPYGELLTDMERRGIYVDVKEHLPRIEAQARTERDAAAKRFVDWVTQYSEDAAKMNIGSDTQKAHLLFAPCERMKASATRGADGRLQAPVQADLSGPAITLGDPNTYAADATRWPEYREFDIENTDGMIEEGKSKAKKMRTIKLRGLGLPPVSRTAGGWPAVSGAVLETLAGDPDSGKFGTAFEHFGGGRSGEAACRALDSLREVSTIETMLSNFIEPLQRMADKNGRIHCSMNLNTETGRLSARRPNLQNQPALEKDRYKIRKAFRAQPGCNLIVADYGQLELRLLAHMTNCRSMIEAFAAGGDFHSRTAMGMYQHVADAVKSGEVLLELDDAALAAAAKPGAKKPALLKNVFASERRKAKILNFSIAYGKTAMGLSKDWGVTLAEAKDTVAKWYGDRPEVKAWQQSVLQTARVEGYTRTLMGRYRELPEINSKSSLLRGHAERAAINTPIQGGAADVVMMAMLKASRDEKLHALGWRMLLQIHDELIFEGPIQSQDEALQLVLADMGRPFEKPLLVDLVVDARIADNWFDAK